jgi:hypothetical protein
VDIDGTYIGVMDQKTTSTTYQKIWKSPLLTTGTHTITFEHTGAGTADLDGIVVLNDSQTTVVPSMTPTRTTQPTVTKTVAPTAINTPSPTMTRTSIPQVTQTSGPTPTKTLPVCTVGP